MMSNTWTKTSQLSSLCFLASLQVKLVFDLEGSACCGELVFMERYKEVLVELGRVEQKMESQSMSSSSSSSEGLGTAAVSGAGRSRLGSSGRLTLQAIGSAAAAGLVSFQSVFTSKNKLMFMCSMCLKTMYKSGCDCCVCFPAGVAFYSISDIADRLLSTTAHPMSSLEEGYWLSHGTADASGLFYSLLEELSPAAMAAFDLACCHCQLWKTSRQLLDTAERRLNSSLEARGSSLKLRVFFG